MASITTILAVVGAVTGSFSAITNVLTYRKNRAVVVVSTHTLSSSEAMQMVVEVRNEGQRPVAIIAIGQAVSNFRGNAARAPFRLLLKPFLMRREKRIRRDDIPYSELAVIMDDEGNETEEIAVLEAGTSIKSVRIPMSVAYSRQGNERVSWAYAQDIYGRKFYSHAHVQPIVEN